MSSSLKEFLQRLNKPPTQVPNANQLAAINGIPDAMHEATVYLDGGPGTGKTFTMGRLLRDWCVSGKSQDITLLAPTHEALRKLVNACDDADNPGLYSGIMRARARTIASFLQKTQRCKKGRIFASDFDAADKDNLEDSKCDIIVIDEISMVSAEDFEIIKSLCNMLVCVGDSMQLPPVNGTPIDWAVEPHIRFPLRINQRSSGSRDPLHGLYDQMRVAVKQEPGSVFKLANAQAVDRIEAYSLSEVGERMAEESLIGPNNSVCITYTNAAAQTVRDAYQEARGRDWDDLVEGDIIDLHDGDPLFKRLENGTYVAYGTGAQVRVQTLKELDIGGLRCWTGDLQSVDCPEHIFRYTFVIDEKDAPNVEKVWLDALEKLALDVKFRSKGVQKLVNIARDASTRTARNTALIEIAMDLYRVNIKAIGTRAGLEHINLPTNSALYRVVRLSKTRVFYHACAKTIHKSQGSSYGKVYVHLTGSEQDDNHLAFVAFTRHRNDLVICE